MRLIGAAFKFGVELHGNEKVVLRQLNSLNQFTVGRGAADDQSASGQQFRVGVVELVAMTVVDKLG